MIRFLSRTFDKSFLACYTDTVRTGRTEKEVTIMAKRISCEYNIDTACVEVRCGKTLILAIDCIAVENTIPRNMFERSELDYLVYNDPAAYADLILSGEAEDYLKRATEYKPLD